MVVDMVISEINKNLTETNIGGTIVAQITENNVRNVAQMFELDYERLKSHLDWSCGMDGTPYPGYGKEVSMDTSVQEFVSNYKKWSSHMSSYAYLRFLADNFKIDVNDFILHTRFVQSGGRNGVQYAK